MISEFRILNWRSFERARLYFGRKNLFTGVNGSGKSNLLEALGFLGILRSFRTARKGELIRQNCGSFHLRGIWQTAGKHPVSLEVAMSRNSERSLQINGLQENSGRNFIQHFFPVVFAPEDMEIVCGLPGVRRKFFDMLASQLDEGYINVLHDYLATLKLRNMLLKTPHKATPEKFDVYEALLAFASADLTIRRQKIIAGFNNILAVLAGDEKSKIHIEYHPQCAEGADSYLELFARSRTREMEKHTTLTGCHLDDFRFYRGGQLMRGFASNGQNRMAALNCKLAAAKMLMHRWGSERLVALVDDVTGELDDANRRQFFQTLAPAGQIFFTCTTAPADSFFEDAKVFTLPFTQTAE